MYTGGVSNKVFALVLVGIFATIFKLNRILSQSRNCVRVRANENFEPSEECSWGFYVFVFDRVNEKVP